MPNTWRRLFVHLVWGTKHRIPTIDAAREGVIERVLVSRVANLRSELLAFGAVDDHVHLLVSLHPTTDVARLVRSMKSATTQAIGCIEASDAPFAWQVGYAAMSIDPRMVDVVRAYVMNQKTHHAGRSVLPDWEPPLDHSSDPE